MNDYRERLKNITTLIFDYDGVLSDGKILFTDDGQHLRNGNVKDGFILQLAVKLGYRVVVISGADTPGMENRLSTLNIKDTFLGTHNKIEVYEQLKKDYQLNDSEILFMGDDLPDYNVMLKVGIACCPADAATDILKISHFVSEKKGGEGCVRDIVEQVLRAQSRWMTPEAFVW